MSFANVNWRITRPVNTANLGYDEADNPIPIPASMWAKRLPRAKTGQKVALLYDESHPVWTTELRGGSTLRHFFQSISDGMHVPFDSGDVRHRSVAYYLIAKRLHSRDRKRLIGLFENDRLTPWHIVNDNYDFFEGHVKYEGGVWVYATGS